MRGPLTIAITGAIGLATETASAFKHRNDVAIEEIDDSDDWMLDETQAELNAEDGNKPWAGRDGGVDEIIQYFVRQHPQADHPTYDVHQHLPNPVILPQRRPRSKARGFIRAYAPVLQERGIDQRMFMDFLQGFDDSIKKQALFMVANVAIGAGVTASMAFIGENIFVDIAAFAVHTTIEMGRRMYIAKKLNTYLLDMNEHIFKPRGLYALVMAYKPKSSEAIEFVDLETSVAVSAAHNGDSGSRFRINSGATLDESHMPIAAPLIFPALQAASNAQKQNAFKKASAFFSDYSDRRAQALFNEQDPDSSLNVMPRKSFSSRFADPTHPVNKGGPLCVLTGGAISFDNKKREKREKENVAAGLPKEQGTGGMMGGMKRRLQENVIYLMIVDMPSEEQLRQAALLEAEPKSAQ